MANYVLKGGQIVNEGKIFQGDIRIKQGRIDKIASSISPNAEDLVLDLNGKHVFPGMIDDQVHFREPGLTHKAKIASESISESVNIAGLEISDKLSPENAFQEIKRMYKELKILRKTEKRDWETADLSDV
jgi:dihydroorotase